MEICGCVKRVGKREGAGMVGFYGSVSLWGDRVKRGNWGGLRSP